eukprot:scaffold2161_cov212-Alexandrium_tamarense.AAC.21
MIPGVLSSKLSVASSVVVSAATAFLDANQPQLLPSTTMEDDEPTPDSYIKLISADSTTFYLQRRIALQVDTIKAMLDGNFRESEEGVIRFPDIGDSALEKVVRYLHYKDKWSNSSARIPEFDIAPEEAKDRHETVRGCRQEILQTEWPTPELSSSGLFINMSLNISRPAKEDMSKPIFSTMMIEEASEAAAKLHHLMSLRET